MNLVTYNILKIIVLFSALVLVLFFLDLLWYKMFTERGKWKKLE